MAMSETTIHHGKNIKRIREMLGLKQEALASEMGSDWNQRKISILEQRELIDPPILEEVAKALKVPVDAIKNYNEEAAIFNIQHNYEGANTGSGIIGNSLNYENCTFNPIEKLIEVVEENRKLYAALLKEKDEKIALIEKLLADNKGKK